MFLTSAPGEEVDGPVEITYKYNSSVYNQSVLLHKQPRLVMWNAGMGHTYCVFEKHIHEGFLLISIYIYKN